MPRSKAQIKNATYSGSSSRPVICPLCRKTISRKNDLNRHILTHNKDKSTYPYGCPFPGCAFRSLQESNLKTHYKTHTGEKDQLCPHRRCFFATSDPGSLTRHRKRRHNYIPRARRRFNEETGLFELPGMTSLPSSRCSTPETDDESDVCLSPVLPASRSFETSYKSPRGFAPALTPDYVARPVLRPASFEQNAMPRAAMAYGSPRSSVSNLTPDYIAIPILRPASFEQSARPRAPMMATGRDDARIKLPSISTWYRDEEGYGGRYEPGSGAFPVPSPTVPCPGCPECDRRYAMSVGTSSASFYSQM